MQTITAHKGNGWNYGLQIGKNKCRAFRYYTNGNINRNYQYDDYLTVKRMSELIGTDVTTISEHAPELSDRIISLYHNAI